MDASCKIQGGIHSFFLVHNMCPELWVHIKIVSNFWGTLQNEQIFSRKFPVPLIAHLQYQNGSNHFVVISKINEKCVWIYDQSSNRTIICVFVEANRFLKFYLHSVKT